eukprot:5448129-Amphidinium_carterae.1
MWVLEGFWYSSAAERKVALLPKVGQPGPIHQFRKGPSRIPTAQGLNGAHLLSEFSPRVVPTQEISDLGYPHAQTTP